ncbi:MAG TPA: OB-fold nucleic acid binding domain-containing protein, partial [Acidimicrobiales bacterium]|nr:OB-fold nucleic acid binding domain-containing protein [Acidimicrobiales bacterium]
MTDHTSSEFRPPYRVEVTDRAADLRDAHADLADGADSGVTGTVAGRVMLLRHMGGRTFATLRDSSGSIQLMATAQDSEDYKDFTALNLGDWIVATGGVIRSRRGELS